MQHIFEEGGSEQGNEPLAGVAAGKFRAAALILPAGDSIFMYNLVERPGTSAEDSNIRTCV